jgi:hypothetical protein
VWFSFHGTTLSEPTLSEREASHFLRLEAQFFSSSWLKVHAAKIHALADSVYP